MGEVINLADRRVRRVKEVKVIVKEATLDERIARIKDSIGRINTLMAELRITSKVEKDNTTKE